MAAENHFVLISFNGIEGILKDNAITQKCSKKMVKDKYIVIEARRVFYCSSLFENILVNLKNIEART